MIGYPNQLSTYLLTLDNSKKYQIKEYREKRNLDQNAKYWALLNELALALGVNKEKLHFEMLKYYSVRYQVAVPHGIELRGIQYFEKKGTTKIDGKIRDVYIVYVPSHELNTKEFALLINGLIQECKQQGIETRSPEEILKEETIYERNNN